MAAEVLEGTRSSEMTHSRVQHLEQTIEDGRFGAREGSKGLFC